MAADVRVIWILLLLAACTTPPRFDAPTWTRHTIPALSRLDTVYSGAGWNGGFVVVGAEERESGRVPVMFTSPDGLTWQEIPAPVTDFAWGTAAAGHGDRAYVLGRGPTVLGSDGWTPIPLPGATPDDRAATIAAGARGVAVATLKENTVRLWHSADGRTFTGPVAVPIEGLTVEPRLVATDRGFFLDRVHLQLHTPPVLLESPDGRVWTDIGAQLPAVPEKFAVEAVDAVQHNGAVTVAFARPVIPGWPGNDSSGLTGWYRTDGTWREITKIGNGRMPDAGVVANHERQIHDVLPWQGGFLAFGTSGETVSVWSSPDGVEWAKTPVRENGFDVDQHVLPVSDGNRVLLLKTGSGDQIWLSGSTR